MEHYHVSYHRPDGSLGWTAFLPGTDPDLRFRLEMQADEAVVLHGGTAVSRFCADAHPDRPAGAGFSLTIPVAGREEPR